MTEQPLLLLMIGCAAGGFVTGYLFGRVTMLDDIAEVDQCQPDVSHKPEPPGPRDTRGSKPAPPVEPAKPKQKYEKPI